MGTERAAKTFQERYGSAPRWLIVAPGRVNLIGEHTDYNDGFVFPAAIDFEIVVAADVTEGPSNMVSFGPGESVPFDAATVAPGQVRGWTRYVAGMAWSLRQEGQAVTKNIRAVVDSNLPMGSGLSSSAAIEMAFGVLWNEAEGLGLNAKALALAGVRCENDFVGMKCGIMDQMASALGKADHALFLDTRTKEIRYAPIPEQIAIVVCDTTKSRALAGSAYNDRRAQCEAASLALGVKALRDATTADLEAAKGNLDLVVYQRAKHVITENQRCLDFDEALGAGDLAKVGRLMRESHESLRDDYAVSCAELDSMAEAAWSAPGVIGARMTGAGFGGACVALVEAHETDAFIEATGAGFREKHPLEPRFLVCRTSDGARVVRAK